MENMESEGYGRIGTVGRLKRTVFFKCHPEHLKDQLQELKKADVDVERMTKIYQNFRGLDESVPEGVIGHYQRNLLDKN